jgi:dipeptidyl aminopeptidase/acylaminoacyl peptidase
MATKKIRAYGIWPSPLAAADVARAARRFGHLQADGGYVYWTEGRPEQRGRQTIMRLQPGGELEDVLPEPFSARSRVHEYGGGEFLVADGEIYFVNDADQDIYTLRPGAVPKRLTRAKDARFADFVLDAKRRRLVAVAERQAGRSQHPQNLLIAIGLEGAQRGKITDLATGHDFYAFPRLSPAGDRLAYVAWDLPDMPWDQSVLRVADVTKSGALRPARVIAGGKGEAASQPQWARDGTLYFVLDGHKGSGLYALRPNGSIRRVARNDAGDLSRPLWVLGSQSYALGQDGTIALSLIERGETRFTVTTASGKPPAKAFAKPPFRSVDHLVAFGRSYVGMATRDGSASAIVVLERDSARVLRSAGEGGLDRGMISRGRVMAFRAEDGRDVFGVFYAPANAGFAGPPEQRPPLVVLVHGGPTAMAERGFKPRIQFYTSRGFAVLDLDYSGSTGYGRAYRERLDGRWGEIDVADAALAARELARRRRVDATRMAIAGGSAGGYTVLMALATSDVFAAGSSHYGISDLGLLLAHTHKFESGYLHRLMGTTPGNWRETFDARSPLMLAGRMTHPVILFQGLDDKVVPPEQSRRIADELRRRNVTVEYLEFAGEGHGFRRAETIIAVLNAELAFLQRVMRLGSSRGKR